MILLMKCISKLSIIVLLLLMASCGSTRQVAIKAIEPAQVDLSHKIVRVGVLNTVEHLEKPELGHGINRLVAIEDQWLNSKGQDAAVHALVEELRKDTRFEVKALDASIGSLESFDHDSTDISWSKIKSICEKHNIDALFSLTHFDAETQVSFRKTKMDQLNMMREKESISAQEITLETLIENGWRIYDPFLEKIVDEYTYNQQLISKAKGVDPVAALRAIGSRKDSILSKGKLTGNSYGERLKPTERQIFRDYFVKGTEKLVQAGESMASGDLRAAIELWKEEVGNSKTKIKGRACYNLAVGMEFGGDLERALEWATMANENLHDKVSQKYLTELESRIRQQVIVEAQLAQLYFDD